MKITIEGREFNLSANGRFMQKYCKLFEENLTLTLYNALEKRDMYSIAKLMYCAINEEKSFDEWLDSFNSPLFLVNHMDEVLTFIVEGTKPTIENKDNKSSKKKKITN